MAVNKETLTDAVSRLKRTQQAAKDTAAQIAAEREQEEAQQNLEPLPAPTYVETEK